MTFNEFLATRIRYTDLNEAADALGLFAEDFGDSIAVNSFDGSWISECNGMFHVHIGHDEWTVEFLEVAARILYVEHHATECVDTWTHESLTDLWTQFLTLYAIDFGLTQNTDAEEAMLIVTTPHPTERTPQQRAAATWIEWFITRWEEV